MSDLEQAAQELRRADDEGEAVEKAASAADAASRRIDRTYIVRWIIRLYVGGVGACILYLIYRGIWCREDVFANIAEIIKIAIIPVVTLVIGYYFGTERRA